VQLEEIREMLAIPVRGNPDMCSAWFLESAWLGDGLRFLGAMEGIVVGGLAWLGNDFVLDMLSRWMLVVGAIGAIQQGAS